MTHRTWQGWLVAWAASVAAACGSSANPTPPSPGADPATTIRISRTGASPRTLTVPRGSQVTFVNEDGSVHEMFSDPHPEHTDCPEFDSVGRLAPGASRQTNNLVLAQTCKFHDHLNPFNTSLTGSVTIQ